MSKKKYALIWWVNSREKDVVALSVIPKNDRVIHKMITLSWIDDKSKKKTRLEAKLLKISSDENELIKTIVTDKGEIHDMSEKIMPSKIIEEERNIHQGQKIAETVARSCKKKLEEKIKSTRTVLQTLDSNLLTVPDKQHPEMPDISSKQQIKPPNLVNEPVVTNIFHQQTQHSMLQTSASRESQNSAHQPVNSNMSEETHSRIPENVSQQPRAVNMPQHPIQYQDAPQNSAHQPVNSNMSEETHSRIPENVSQQPRAVNMPQHPIQYQDASQHSAHQPVNSNMSEETHSRIPENVSQQPRAVNMPQHPIQYQDASQHSAHQPAISNMCQYSSHNETSLNMYQYPQQPTAVHVSQNFQNTYNTNNTSGLLDIPEYTYLGKTSYHPKPSYSVMPSSDSITNSAGHINKAQNYSSTHTDLQSPQSTSTSEALRLVEVPVTQNNDEAESNSESDSNDHDDRKNETAQNTIVLPFKVTPSFVNFLGILHDCFANILEEDKIAGENSTIRAEKFKISSIYLTGGGTKVEVYPGCGFWLQKPQNDWVNLKISGHESDWRLLAREILTAVYGTRLSEFSATGRRSSRPRIHPKLYEGLFKRINEIASTSIEESTFISFINKECGNRRKSKKKKNQNE